jgi:hypothetical protein
MSPCLPLSLSLCLLVYLPLCFPLCFRHVRCDQTYAFNRLNQRCPMHLSQPL